jgi:hypothetical protein
MSIEKNNTPGLQTTFYYSQTLTPLVADATPYV